MNLPQAYSTVVKYGIAPEDGVRNWLNLASKEQETNQAANMEEGLSHPDNFFADWLEENDDPRHQIVRKDLEIRKYPGRWNEKEYANTVAKTGSKLHQGLNEKALSTADKPHGFITALKLTNPATPHVMYRVHWMPTTQPVISYVGHFTPEEFKSLASEINPQFDISSLD